MNVIEKRTDELKLYERNAKIHSERQIDLIAKSITLAKGLRQPIVIDKDNVVVAGHGRLLATLAPKYEEIKKLCHENGLRFFCCEEGLECTGDDLTCCGTENLDGFTPNRYNVSHIAYDDDPPEATEAMKQTNTYRPFKAIGQNQIFAKSVQGKSFEQLMYELGESRIEYLRGCKKKYEED